MMALQGWSWNMLLVPAFLRLGGNNGVKHSTHDDTTGGAWNMLLFSAFLHLGGNNGMKHSTHDDTTRVVVEHVARFCVTIFE